MVELAYYNLLEGAGQTCRLVIDGGSSENLIFKETGGASPTARTVAFRAFHSWMDSGGVESACGSDVLCADRTGSFLPCRHPMQRDRRQQHRRMTIVRGGRGSFMWMLSTAAGRTRTPFDGAIGRSRWCRLWLGVSPGRESRPSWLPGVLGLAEMKILLVRSIGEQPTSSTPAAAPAVPVTARGRALSQRRGE